jgi:protein-tyrosine phosphatase
MEHVYWVIEGLLAGRAGPTRAPWDARRFYEAGLRTVVSLASEVRVEDLEAYGLRHYRVQLPPVLLSSPGMQKAFIHEALPVWAFIDEELGAGRPTLVHCYAGNDRTGAILAGYLVAYRGVEPEEAVQRLLNLNPNAMERAGYADAVRRLTPGRLPDRRTLL